MKYIYSCTQCGGAVKKAPLVAQSNWQKMQESKSYQGLGGWKCLGSCRGHIIVKRQMAAQEE